MFFGRFQTPLQPQPQLSATVPKMLFIYPRLVGRIEVPGVARKQKNQDTQDSQHVLQSRFPRPPTRAAIGNGP